MIHTVTLNPALDKTVRIDSFAIDAVNRIESMRCDPGGKGINVSKVIASLGGSSIAFALLGGDTGRRISNGLDELSIRCQAFDAGGETRTNLKIVDPVSGTHTDINEAGPAADATTLAAMLDALVAAIRPGDIVVISGSLPRDAATDTYAVWTSAAVRAGGRVFLDADGDALRAGIDGAPSLVKPNDVELERLVGHPLRTEGELIETAQSLVAGGIGRVIVSRGAAGALFVSDEIVLRASAPRVRVRSTVGAGDAVVAALALAEDRGVPEREAIALGMAAGAANVMSRGTEPAPRELVESLIDQVRIEPL